MLQRLRYVLPLLAALAVFGHAGAMAFGGEDPGRAFGRGIRGGDLVSFWAGGTLIARGDRANLYTLKRSRPVVAELYPKKPPIYPVGYPPPIYQLFALPQPAVSYFDTARVLLLAMAGLQLGIAGIIVRTTPELRRWRPEALAALIALPGFFSTMWAGQLSSLWTIVLVGGLALPPVAGGVLLGLLWIKPTISVPAFVALALLGEGRRAGGMIAGGAIVLVLSLLAGGTPEWIGFADYLGDPGHIVDAYFAHWSREVTLRALIVWPIRKAAYADAAGWAATAIGWLMLLGAAWLARRSTDRAFAVATVFAVSFATAAHLLDYDQGVFLPALIPSVTHLLSGRTRYRWPGIVTTGLAWFMPALVEQLPKAPVHVAALAMMLWVAWMLAELRAATIRGG